MPRLKNASPRRPVAFRARVLECRTLEELARALERTGSDPEGVGIMTRKGLSYVVEVDPVPVQAAIVLKQEMLALGGDSSHHRDVAALSTDTSRVVLMATWGQFLRLFPKLRRQPFRLGPLADTVEAALRNYTHRGPRKLRLAHGRSLSVGERTLVMGVVNVTPDSFYDGGRFATTGAAVAQGMRLVSEGADLLDVGGESTRPGSTGVDESEELRRVLPVLKELRAKVEVPLSIDTRKPAVAREALRAGADLVNDVTGLGDAAMRHEVHAGEAAAVVMHMRGTPAEMQKDTHYDDLRGEVLRFLAERTEAAEHDGVGHDQIVIDPGIGFAKSFEGNLDLLDHLGELRSLGYPVLVGASRKAFLGALTGGTAPEGRLHASVAAAVSASLRGAEIVRVHDVAPTVEGLRVADGIRRGRLPAGTS